MHSWRPWMKRGLTLCVTIAVLVGPSPGLVRGEEPYFPNLGFSDDEDSHIYAVSEVGPALFAMNEPSLWRLSRADQKVTAYRLLWLNGRFHPMSVRITSSAGGASLVAVELDGHCGPEYPANSLPKVVVKKTVPISGMQWARLNELVEKGKLWSQPASVDREDRSTKRVVLEGVQGGKYHAVDRVYVRKEMTELHRYMLELSGLEWQQGPFFPEKVFADDEPEEGIEKFFMGNADSRDEWFSSHLVEMKERSLWKLSQRERNAEVLRLLWLPQQRHPVSVRIVHKDGTATVSAAELDGSGGAEYESGRLVFQKTVKLTSAQWKEVVDQLDEVKFWTMPTMTTKWHWGDSNLVLEGVKAGKYHIVVRCSGVGRFGKLCRYLLDIPGLEWSIPPFAGDPVQHVSKPRDFLTDGVHDHIWAMREPSLRTLSQTDRTAIAFRFRYSPTFYRPLSLRVMKSGASITLTAVQLDGMGGYAPGNVALRKTVTLSQNQWEQFEREAEKLKFWDLPEKVRSNVDVMDGESLSLEGAAPGKYHRVYRSTPIPADYMSLFISMLKLSGLDRKVAFDVE